MGVVTYTTSDTGQFSVGADEPCESWVTLTFQKDGFDTMATQIKGRPDNPLELCMTPAAAP
jgi:hypothetical protein